MAFKPEYLLWPFTEKICGSLLSAWEGNLAFMGHPQTVFLVLFSSFSSSHPSFLPPSLPSSFYFFNSM